MKVGDYVVTTLKDWQDRGFIEPKYIYAIKNNCANLGGRFNSCYVGHLKIVKAKPAIVVESEIAILFQKAFSGSIAFRFDKVKLVYSNN